MIPRISSKNTESFVYTGYTTPEDDSTGKETGGVSPTVSCQLQRRVTARRCRRRRRRRTHDSERAPLANTACACARGGDRGIRARFNVIQAVE